MKRFIILLLSVTLLFAAYMHSAPKAKASEATGRGLSIYTTDCPSDAVTYAKEAYKKLLNGAFKNGSISYVESASLGSPFTIFYSQTESTVYYFPIFSQNKVIATMRIYHDLILSQKKGSISYTGILSEYMVDELNTLLERNDIDSPVCLFMYNNNVMMYADTEVTDFLVTDSFSARNYNADPPSTGDFISIDPTLIIDSTHFVQNMLASRDQVQPLHKFLTLSIVETQGSNNSWCGAYCTAIIIRYLTSNPTIPTAYSLMYYVYGPDLNGPDSFSVPDTLAAGVRYGFSPVRSRQPISKSQVYAEICAGKPIYITGKRYDSASGEKKYHALVINGYDSPSETYSIWNPWYNYYETMDEDTLQYVTGNLTYTWNETVYDW